METTPELINHLYALMKENILPDHSFKLDYQWAGTMGIGPTKEPIVTRIDNHVFAGVRMGGMGVAIGAMVGEKLSKLVLNG